MKELIEREVMRKGIMRVLQEKADKVQQMQVGGQILEEYLARLEYQTALALATN